MADETPINLAEIADACREAGYVVAEIDRGLEVSGSEDGGAFYLFAASTPCSRPSPAPSSA